MASGRSHAVAAGDGVFGPAGLSTTASLLMVGGGLGSSALSPGRPPRVRVSHRGALNRVVGTAPVRSCVPSVRAEG